MLIIIGIFLLIIGAILTIIPILHKRYVKNQFKYLGNVPGPKPNIYFGNLHLFFGKGIEEYLEIISNFFKEYGNITKVYRGPLSTMVLVSDEAFIEYILSSNKLINKPKEYKYFENWLGTGLITSGGQKWKTRRKMITPAFHFSILENFVGVFEEVGQVFIKKLSSNVNKPSFDIYPLLNLLTLDIICETAMGVKINAQTDENSAYAQSVHKISYLINQKLYSVAVAISYHLYPLTINYYKEKIALKTLHKYTDQVIDKRCKDSRSVIKDKIDENGIKKKIAFLDLLLSANSNGQYLSRKDIREEVDTFMFAGMDTLSSAISFTLYALANNYQVQEKAFNEQKNMFSDLKNARPTMANLNEMKYLELVIKETLRLYPPVPMFGRMVDEEFKWNNIVFPKGKLIAMFPFVCHRNPEYFPEPLKFIPERFETVSGKHPYMYIPFSAGPRNCIGKKFAMLELKSVVSNILRHYELLPAANFTLKLIPQVTLMSKSGVFLSIKERS
ncbi:cytochrome P450 4c3-like isoform X1 [Diabrotica virgifera virgifera]|uniref:Cytochrome P450 4c3-like isoform X1 n=1 Tax=Diabrotica virgifera virgifera TaxID=50390 RepID=A0A6P7G187_DIAVI|nr:cytochrome P450 4c3-like isoform X1 [Diabrotica virgifera virgifera]